MYFGTLGSHGHSWWPIFLYPIFWPWSTAVLHLGDALTDWLAPNPKSAPKSVWIAIDAICGFAYIVGGTIWIWCLAKASGFLLRRLGAVRSDQ